MAVPPTVGAGDWAERTWATLARSYLRTDRLGRVVGIERRRRVDAWTTSQLMAAAQVRALRHAEGWATYDGLQVGFTDHLYRGLGYTAAAQGRPEVYYDDNAWVGLVAVGAVLARGAAGATLAPEVDRDLAQARLILRLLRDGEDADRGGVYWRVGGDTRNACSTGPAGLLAVRVVEAERALGCEVADHGDLVAFGRRCAEFLDRLAGDDHLVRDHERSDGSIDPLLFSYNQGTAIGLRVQLARAGGSQDLARAHTLAEAALQRYGPGDELSVLWRDCPAFVSILARNLLSLFAMDDDPRWLQLVDTWRGAVERSARDRAGRYVRNGIATYGRHHALDTAGVSYAHSARELDDRLYALLT